MKSIILEALTDKVSGTGSMTRLAGAALVLAAIVHSFLPHHDATLIGELLVAGLGALGLRKKADGTFEEESTDEAVDGK